MHSKISKFVVAENVIGMTAVNELPDHIGAK